MTPPTIQYTPDTDVDARLDLELRGLLSLCFTAPQDHVFQHRRYFHEMPPHRWMIRAEDGTLAAHLALHERTLTAIDGDNQVGPYKVGGIAEVCVHPDHRSRGYLKALVAQSHRWMRERDYVFSVLFGYERHYASSGYVPVTNLYHDARDGEGRLGPRRAQDALAFPLSDIPWPSATVAYLPGLEF